MVRKGMKTGLHVKVDNTAIDFLADTHENNMKAIGGKPKPHRSPEKAWSLPYRDGCGSPRIYAMASKGG